MENKSYTFSIESIFKDLPTFNEKKITELTVNDLNFSSDKAGILRLTEEIKKHCPDLFLSLLIDPKVIDRALVDSLSEIYCSLEIPVCGTEKNGTLLFDKKFYSGKANILNEAGLVFGFNMAWGMQTGDTFKLFRDRLDFAASLYPNHIDFEQLERTPYEDPKPTGIYSSKDMDFSRGMAFACKVFYSQGRAVPWFNSVLHALKINASSFFADFEEFQQCNNCSFEVEFDGDEAGHKAVEKLQLMFLSQKFEEKNKSHLFAAVNDIVKINGAFSRCSSDGTEEDVELSYNPEDLLSPYSLNIADFAENVAMESTEIKIFETDEGPDFKIIG
ncbi:MAG: hypothetical protein Q4B64_05485 [Spirochaetales bacterium]|nr:hypothetical protein [Spirochaetales bacterium]